MISGKILRKFNGKEVVAHIHQGLSVGGILREEDNTWMIEGKEAGSGRSVKHYFDWDSVAALSALEDTPSVVVPKPIITAR